jgi:hypothetical protein
MRDSVKPSFLWLSTPHLKAPIKIPASPTPCGLWPKGYVTAVEPALPVRWPDASFPDRLLHSDSSWLGLHVRACDLSLINRLQILGGLRPCYVDYAGTGIDDTMPGSGLCRVGQDRRLKTLSVKGSHLFVVLPSPGIVSPWSTGFLEMPVMGRRLENAGACC